MPHSKSPHDYEETFWKLAKLLSETKKTKLTLEHPHAGNFRHRWYAFLRTLADSDNISHNIMRDQAFKFKCTSVGTRLDFTDKAAELEETDSMLTALLDDENISPAMPTNVDVSPGTFTPKVPGESLEDELRKLFRRD